MMPRMGKWLLLLICAGLIACAGEALEGSYQDPQGVTRYQFQSDGTVLIAVLGTDIVAEYTLDGEKVFITSAQGTVVLFRRDNRLHGPMGMVLQRVPKQAMP